MSMAAEVVRAGVTDTPRVSVIVTVRNVARLLPACIESILRQANRDFELICVDEGSTDDSLDILIHYAEADARMTVLRQQHAAADVARNEGLTRAKGEYLLFLNGGDTFDANLIKATVAAADEVNADVVCFDAEPDSGDMDSAPQNRCLSLQYTNKLKVFSSKEVTKNLFCIVMPVPWNRLFRRAFVQGAQLQFQPFQGACDLYFSCMAMCLAERITCVDQKLVRYRTVSQGEMTGLLAAHRLLYDTLCQMSSFDKLKTNYFTRLTLDLAHILYVMTAPDEADSVYRSLEEHASFQALLSIEEAEVTSTVDFANVMRFYWMRKHAQAQPAPRQRTHVVLAKGQANAPKVSVLIPVYNSVPYLRECLDSVLRQTMQDFEVIAVNDGSKDESLSILLEYAEKDKRITVISQENSGVSAARNVAATYAQGEYQYFLDSDDALAPEMLALTYEKASREKLDVLLFNCEIMPGAENVLGAERLVNSQRYYSRSRAYDSVYRGDKLFCELRANHDFLDSVCLQLTSRAYYTEFGAGFDEGFLHEDQLYTFKHILQARRISHLNKALFLRRFRADSIMTTAPTFAHTYAFFHNYLMMTRFQEGRAFDYSVMQRINEYISLILKYCREKYAALPQAEKYKQYALPASEQRLFGDMVVRPCHEEARQKQISDRLIRANENLQKVREENLELRKYKPELQKTQQELQKCQKESSETAARHLYIIEKQRAELAEIKSTRTYKLWAAVAKSKKSDSQ